MTSINFNSAATTALRTLQQTNSALETSQNRVSTGLKIGEAKDNAAYWSISTTLKSDNKALATVSDALGLGSAAVDTAYQGLNKTLEVLDEIKAKLTAASQPGVNRDVIQSEITELQKQLSSIAEASSFSGENWLSVGAGAATTKNVVSGFTRTANGGATIATIEVNVGAIKLYDTVNSDGLLDVTRSVTGYASATTGTFDDGTAVSFAAGGQVTFSVSQAGVTKQATIDKNLIDGLGLANSTIRSNQDLVAVYAAAMTKAGISGVDAKVSVGGAVTFESAKQFTVAYVNETTTTGASIGMNTATSAVASTNVASTGSVKTLNISSAALGGTDAQVLSKIQSFISIVNSTIADVTKASSTLGAVASRIDLQETFVNNLMDTIDKGVSGLVDADLSEESTRLQALQTKQQLGIQALSIANTSTQNILSLFRS